MPIGTTNIFLSDDGTNGGIFSDLNPGAGGAQTKFSDVVFNDWAAGPSPGDGTNSYFGYGLKTGLANPLYNPMNSAGGSQISSNYKFSYFKNSYAYFDQANYVIDLYIENNIPPAGRGDPPNEVTVDFGLYDDTLTSNSICPIGGNAPESTTSGPTDVSQPYTFNVEYFYIEGGIANLGLNPYNFDLIVDGTTVLSLGGSFTQPVDYTMFSSVPTNTGNGFVVECIFN